MRKTARRAVQDHAGEREAVEILLAKPLERLGGWYPTLWERLDSRTKITYPLREEGISRQDVHGILAYHGLSDCGFNAQVSEMHRELHTPRQAERPPALPPPKTA